MARAEYPRGGTLPEVVEEFKACRPPANATAKERRRIAQLFYPGPGENADEAKRICAACPVRRPCLEWALANAEFGIWGGTSERERRRINKQRGASRSTVTRRRLALTVA